MFRRRVLQAWLLVAPLVAAAAPLAFRIDEGANINSFFREGTVAAHLVLRSGTEPRILVAFPAGNSGVALWFETTAQAVTWKLSAAPRPIVELDGRRRPLRGVEFDVETDASELRPHAAVLSSVRVLRDFELRRQAPSQVRVEPRVDAAGMSWRRDRLDGAAGYRLSFQALAGGRVSDGIFTAAAGAPLRLRVRALTGETPLTPLASLLDARAGEDPRAREALAFLSYQEKFLAGSWRFDTYFGRDTLISVLLLAEVLEPPAVESALASVLDRLAANGEVAHEEDIGEFAVLRNAREGRGRIATPIHDYGMVDDDFLLAPLAARWLLDDRRGRARAAAFLASQGVEARPHGTALARNLTWLVERAAAFARRPSVANLVGIKSGRMTGDWRDSEQGLGGGRYAYDINAALVPAALAASARLFESGLLDPYVDAGQREILSAARVRAQVWMARAAPYFDIDIPADVARDAIAGYAGQLGVDGEAALRSLGKSALAFHALSLDERGMTLPILHSDEGFRLLLTDPPAAQIERCIVPLMRPFPAGLMTEIGLLVANPVAADPGRRRDFDRFAYHGTVVWSWQQALLAAGIEHQLRRSDLPSSVLATLRHARATLWAAIERSSGMRTSELWSWSYAGGHYRIEPFGRQGSDVDESNAVQLWSTVYLGIAPGGNEP